MSLAGTSLHTGDPTAPAMPLEASELSDNKKVMELIIIIEFTTQNIN